MGDCLAQGLRRRTDPLTIVETAWQALLDIDTAARE